MKNFIKKITIFLSLFTSSASLFCCAVPAVFVLLGLGSVFASITSFIPQLIWIAEKKNFFFLIGGTFLIISIFFQYGQKNVKCDPSHNKNCGDVKKWSKALLKASLILYIVALFFAFVLPQII